MIYNPNLKIFEKKEKYLKTNVIYRIDIESKILNKLQNFKILYLSDTHFQNKKYLKEEYNLLKKKFMGEKFDIVIHSGDIIDKNVDEFKIEFQEFLKSLKSKYGKYYVYGNHDLYKKKQIKRLDLIMKKVGFENITNNSKLIKIINEDYKLNLIGLDDNIEGKPNYNLALKKINKDDFNILITHNLDVLKKEKMNYFNLILSGHLHAGEFNLGLIDGTNFLKYKKHFKNIHKQKKGFKLLSNRTISFIHPGNFCFICEKTNRIINRLFTKKAGPVIIKIK